MEESTSKEEKEYYLRKAKLDTFIRNIKYNKWYNVNTDVSEDIVDDLLLILDHGKYAEFEFIIHEGYGNQFKKIPRTDITIHGRNFSKETNTR